MVSSGAAVIYGEPPLIFRKLIGCNTLHFVYLTFQFLELCGQLFLTFLCLLSVQVASFNKIKIKFCISFGVIPAKEHYTSYICASNDILYNSIEYQF